MKLRIPLVFKQVIETEKPYVWLDGGRVGGKTSNTALIAILTLLERPNTDIIVARANYGSLGDSSFAEFENAIEMFEDYSDEFQFKKSPLRIERKHNLGCIYFLGIGGSNMNRTKGLKTKHPVSVVIVEETQELREKRSLDEALASWRRRFGERVKCICIGNPPPQEVHWFNVMRKEKEKDNDWLCVRVTWKDIVAFLNDYDLKEIIKTKLNDENYYNWFYMGETVGGYGSVYPMFRISEHVITEQQFRHILETTSIKIVGMIIGGDGAVTHDATAFTPWLLLNNGQMVCANIFYHNPQTDGVIGYHNLVQDYLTKWVDDVCSRYFLGTIKELRMFGNNGRFSPIVMFVDSAAPDLIQECRFFLSDRIEINPVRKSTIMEMVGITQSAISNGNVIIIDYGGYQDYYQNKWIKKDVNLLAEQFSNLIWNDRQTGYDPSIPNDVSDSGTYAIFSHYQNMENIQWFNIAKMNMFENPLIQDIIKNKEN